MNDSLEKLFSMAKSASNKAYSPYSKFCVGAAILTKSNKIFTGCNIENASYGATVCAERTAIFKAVSEGEKDFLAIAIFVDSDKLFPPCGMCRQVMSEFSDDLVIIYGNDNKIIESNIKKLLPESFSLNKEDK